MRSEIDKETKSSQQSPPRTKALWSYSHRSRRNGEEHHQRLSSHSYMVHAQKVPPSHSSLSVFFNSCTIVFCFKLAYGWFWPCALYFASLLFQFRVLYEKLYGSVRSPRKRGKIKRKGAVFVDNFFRLEWQLENFIIFFAWIILRMKKEAFGCFNTVSSRAIGWVFWSLLIYFILSFLCKNEMEFSGLCIW